ncbi:MAG: FAD-dependent thymidylate synthase, partial [Desulfobacterales bacterium]|nr:FAD-dependent thymidylate synthase [Desulfobacterales bacterium]
MQKKLIFHEEHRVGDHDFRVNFWAGEVAEIELIDYPKWAEDTLIMATRGYSGRYDSTRPTDSERVQFLDDIKNTKLGTPIEMLNFVFLVRDVPRSFTHQIVRTRIGASYVQESTRFIGVQDDYNIFVPKTLQASSGGVLTSYVR